MKILSIIQGVLACIAVFGFMFLAGEPDPTVTLAQFILAKCGAIVITLVSLYFMSVIDHYKPGCLK